MDRWGIYNLLKNEKVEELTLATIENEVMTTSEDELKEGVIEYLYAKKRQSQAV